MAPRNRDRCRSSTQLDGLFKVSAQPDGILYPDYGNGSSAANLENGIETALSDRVRESGPQQPSKPRRPTSLICCTLAGGDKPHNCVWRSCKVGVCPNASLGHATRHGVQATNVNGSISSHSRDEAGSIRSNLSFQAFCTMDGLSKAAASNAARPLPQRTPAAPGTSSPRPDSQPATQSADTEALYIFSPRHESTACYLYAPKDSQSKDMYEVDHVPVRVVKDCGGSAYMIAVSDKDEIVDTLKSRSTSRDSKTEPGQTTGPTKADGSPHSSTDDSGPGLGGAELYVRQRQGHSSKGIGPSMVRIIVNRVKDQLQARDQRRTGVHIVSHTGNRAADGKGLYLVSDEDIAAAVNAAAADLDHTDTSEWPSRSSSKVSSTSSNSLSLPKLSSQMNAITPRLSAAADPATTFSVPKPSFSSLGRADSRRCINNGLNIATRATVVSRRSVAEIIWTENQPHGQESGSPKAPGTISRVISNDSSAENGALAVQPPANGHVCQTGVDTTGCSPHQYSVPETLENLVADIGKRGSLSTDEESNITSFPELRPRHCTQEWLNPPVEMEQLTRPPSADLYQLGVDAHSGGVSQLPGGCLEEPVNKTQRCNHSRFQEDPFCYANIYSFERRATEGCASISAEKRLGAAIGSASRRRRSSQVADYQAPQPDCEEGLLPSVFDRLRKRGEKMFHLHDCPEESDGTGAATPANSPANDRRSGTGPRSRDSLIRERTPQPPRPDIAGIYEAMTGSRMLVPRQRRDTCSEDNRPHVCEDDMDSVSMGVASPT
ncbi:Uncharacterized protein TPAR_02521 [Tolypocladium paradoxum]|uniref:Uncharacterized protein n=1 Tax=Tolypocladium paradoxum TaxID=94208 RepID=A0A2S4L4F9_9HYPO|nr:Uncharacterized protein TPAR_02521 [Tolypocladium paradoxum]